MAVTARKISFAVTRREFDLIDRIVARAARIARKAEVWSPGFDQELRMDLTAVHANGCALRLDELAEAPDFDFAHDVFGIRRHLDRRTAELGACFVPRFAVSQ